jgi:hypothetical protein
MNDITLTTMRRTGRVSLRLDRTPTGVFAVNTPGTLRFAAQFIRVHQAGALRGVGEYIFDAGDLGMWVAMACPGHPNVQCHRVG